MTILIVDDDRDTREMYALYLERSGVDVVTASDGTCGLEVARTQHPDVIVLDMSMPGMDGFSVARELKASPATADIPVIALTAAITSREAARAAGCDAYIAKPCLPDLLLWQVRAFFAMPS